MTADLRALIAEWRTRASDAPDDALAAQLRTCARELKAALAVEGEPARGETDAADVAELAGLPGSYETPVDHYREMARRFNESRDELKHENRRLHARIAELEAASPARLHGAREQTNDEVTWQREALEYLRQRCADHPNGSREVVCVECVEASFQGAREAQDDVLTDCKGVALETMAKGLGHYLEWHGSDHDEDCPGDDTCACSWKPVNDGANMAYRFIKALAEHPASAPGPVPPAQESIDE